MPTLLQEPTGELQTSLLMRMAGSTSTAVDADILGDSTVSRRLAAWEVDYSRARQRFDHRTAADELAFITTSRDLPSHAGIVAWFLTSGAGMESSQHAHDLPESRIQIDAPEGHVLSAVANIARSLGVTESAVVRAAGIRRRTFYHWKRSPDVQPRLASTARLWELAQAVHTMDDYAGPGLARWFRADRARARMFERGEFDELTWQAMSTGTPRPVAEADEWMDRAMSAGALDTEPARHGPDSRPVREAKPATRARRAGDEV